MREGSSGRQPDRRRWLGLAGALVILGLAGCTAGRQAQQPGGPEEQVAGQRQVEETRRVVQEAGLPEQFAFAGQVWNATRVQWADEATMSPTQAPGTTPGNEPPGTQPGQPGTTPGSDEAGQPPADSPFVPVADLMVEQHPIYRNTTADPGSQAAIFLRAENVSREMAGQTTSGTAFVEYAATAETFQGMELPQILQAANLPETVSYQGKSWQAQELQRYDPAAFSGLRALPQQLMGHTAYTADDPNVVWLKGEASATAPGAEGQQLRGPVFVRYEPR